MRNYFWLGFTYIVMISPISCMEDKKTVPANPQERLALIIALSSEQQRTLTPEQIADTHPGHIKTIVHYVMTGELVDEQNVNHLIPDAQYNNEYAQFYPVQVEALRNLGHHVCTDFTERDLLELAQDVLRMELKDYKKRQNLHILDLIRTQLSK